MTEARKRSLDEILNEAQTLPPGEQLRFIREACASEGASHAGAAEQMQSRQQWPDIDSEPPPRSDELRSDAIGQLIGSYRIIRSVGQGGMGEVFLAERADDQFRQQVAIKLVRRGLLSPQVQGRLRQERQILASLDHPNIARLYDGGTTSDGTPYIVMEYIDGEPIDVYCDNHRLSIEQRLRLFVAVCGAVHRAHQNLIVHRDLKPSNILVTPDGIPKLLDFGIAKLLDEHATAHTLALTQADVRVMTPDYASPEQIRGELISTASDIYVLGVLLYELLSGYRAFALRGNRLAELERDICERAPPALRAVIVAGEASPDDAIRQIADQRSTSIARLRRELRGDLNNIVMMAMRKEPERRYSSVEQFTADIERFLKGMPVLARADSLSYRAGKFVRRHALIVSLSASLILSLIGFTAAVYVQSKRIGVERDVAQAERSRAESERERAETVSSFLVDSFRLADPFARSRGGQTAREILDSGAARIGRELRDQPELQATMLDTIGSVYLGLGLPEQARPLIEQGLSVRRELFGSESMDVARSLYNLNRVYEKQGDLETSEALALESLAIHRRQTGGNSLETAGSLCRLGVIQEERGKLTEAEQLFNQCLDIRVSRLGRYHADITVPLDNLARIAWLRNDNTVAEKFLREALDIDRRVRGKDHPQYIRHLHRLAQVTYDKGDPKAAEELFRQSIAAHRRVLTDEHPETIDAMSSLGTFLMETGRLEEAEKILRNVLGINRRLRGSRHAYVGNDLENLGRLAFSKANYVQAEKYFNEALSIYHGNLRPGHGLIAATLSMLGRSYLAQGRAPDAEEVLSKAVQSWLIEYGENSSGYAMARAALGRSWALQGRFDQAEPALLESYPIIMKSTRIADRQSTRQVRRWIEDLYQTTGRPEAAHKYLASLDAASDKHEHTP